MVTRILFATAFMVLAAASATATVWHLEPDGSGDAPTIQAAVNLAVAGDTIELACGTYYEHDIVVPIAITLRGVTGDLGCATIDAQRHGRVVNCLSFSGEFVCSGITFTNGYLGDAIARGAGISCHGEALSLDHCAFIDNYAFNAGGGLFSENNRIEIAYCRFVGNAGENGGGGALRTTNVTGVVQHCWFEGNRGIDGAGMFLSGTSPNIDWCVFLNNDGWFFGGGIFCQDYSEPVIDHCSFVGNEAYLGSGIMTAYYTEVTMTNSIVAFNRDGAGIHCDGGSTTPSHLQLVCSDVFGNDGGGYSGLIEDQTGLNGNLADDPLFCDAATGELTLAANSPCLAENNTCAQLMGVLGEGCPVTAVAELLPVLPRLNVHPNPFNPRTTVSFTLPSAGLAVVAIYDARGMEVARLVDRALAAGAHTVDWDGRDAHEAAMPSGTYFCRLTTSGGIETKKVSLLR